MTEEEEPSVEGQREAQEEQETETGRSGTESKQDASCIELPASVTAGLAVRVSDLHPAKKQELWDRIAGLVHQDLPHTTGLYLIVEAIERLIGG